MTLMSTSRLPDQEPREPTLLLSTRELLVGGTAGMFGFLMGNLLQFALTQNEAAGKKNVPPEKAFVNRVSPERAIELIEIHFGELLADLDANPDDFAKLVEVDRKAKACVWALMEVEHEMDLGPAVPLPHGRDVQTRAAMDRIRSILESLRNDRDRAPRIRGLRVRAEEIVARTQRLLQPFLVGM